MKKKKEKNRQKKLMKALREADSRHRSKSGNVG